ncbi:MAG: hypothetical protein OCU16_05625 [Candidatus Methanospirare jalkutatii]|nr:hypothetical protein [Candidatus Methanospirare jalkutatii]
MTSSASATAIITIGDSNSDMFSEANVTVTVPLNIEDVAAEIEVKAVGGANESSELELEAKKLARGKRKKHFQRRYGYEVWGCATAGFGYYRYAAAAVWHKIKK